MDIHQELARIFAGAIPKLTDTEARAVIQHEKYHDEIAAYIEDELRLIISSLETARVTVQEVYKALNRHDIPIAQMMICAEDCLTESIDEAYKKLKGRRPAGRY
tara:strand:+ start:80 stop:391 length:312 start_codon:yes stop_codon:yes gene_type:complete